MNPNRAKFALAVTLLVIGILACNLPVKAPTPIPTITPDLTATAFYAAMVTPPSLAVTATPVPATPVPATPVPTSPPPSNTNTPMPSATSAPTSTTSQLTRSAASVTGTFLSNPPTIDSDLGDWKLTAYAVDSVVFGADQWKNTADLSGSVMVGWDDKNLYLGVHVTDDVYVQNASGHHLYEGDSLEVLLDTRLAVDFYTNALSPDDFQLGISPGIPSVGSHPEAYLWLPTTVEGYRTQVVIAARKTDSGYDVEAAIPWSVFEMTPQAGQHYGFCFSISDNDKVGDIVQQSMVSNVPTRHLTRPMTWGDLLLSK